MELNFMNPKIPTLRQNDSSFQRYRNPLNETRNKSESNSFEQKPDVTFQVQAPYMYYQSTPIYPILSDNKNPMIEQAGQFLKFGGQNSLASMIQQQNDVQNEFKLNQTTYGSKILCEIDCLLVDRYFNQKYWIFQQSNQRYKLDKNKLTNQEWMKNRIQHRYKSAISDSFSEMLAKVVKEGEIQMTNRTQALEISNVKVFQNLERQISKQIKSEKSLDEFLLEIQKLLSDFLFTSFNS